MIGIGGKMGLDGVHWNLRQAKSGSDMRHFLLSRADDAGYRAHDGVLSMLSLLAFIQRPRICSLISLATWLGETVRNDSTYSCQNQILLACDQSLRLC